MLNGTLKSLQREVSDSTILQPHLAEMRLKMTQIKLEIMENQTKRTKKMSEEAMTQQRESKQRMSETLNKLSKFQEQEVTQRDVIYILFEGTRQFAALKYQWTHLLQFLTDDVVEPFSQLCMIVSNIIEVSPKSPL